MEFWARRKYTPSVTSKLAVLISALVTTLILSGCAQQQHSLETVKNSPSEFYGELNANGSLFTQQSVPKNVFSAPLNYRVDKPIVSSASSQAPLPVALTQGRNALPLSPGDLIEVMMEYGEGFNGTYVLDNLGLLSLPIINPIDASGISPKDLSDRIELALIKS